MAESVESLKKENEALQKEVESLGKENRELKNEIDDVKKQRIWGIETAKNVFQSSAWIMLLLSVGVVVFAKEMNTGQAAVLVAIVIGWYVLVVTFCQIFGRNDDTWR